MTKRPKAPAPLDPGIRPNGVRARALRAVKHGPVPEDREKLKASQEFWRAFREGQALLARAEQEGARLGRPPTAEIVIKKTALPTPNLAVVTTKVANRFASFVLDDVTGEITNLTGFASVAAALIHHDQMARAARVEGAAE